MRLEIDASEFERNMNSLQQRLKTQSPMIVKKGIQRIYDETQMLVPRDTGTLASTGKMSIAASNDGSDGTVSYGEIDAYNSKSRALVSDYIHQVVEDPIIGNNFVEKAVQQTTEEVLQSILHDIGVIIDG